MSRRSKHRGRSWFRQDLLPFLSIMLGLMSVMALTTLAITVSKRNEMRDQVVVKMVAIPDQFEPLQIRCRPQFIEWQDDDGDWHSVSHSSIAALAENNDALLLVYPSARDFMGWLDQKVRANAAMSYERRQHTIILWIEPRGIVTSQLFEYMIARRELPIRIGKLPATEEDMILAP